LNKKLSGLPTYSLATVSDIKVFHQWLDGRAFNLREIRAFFQWAANNRSPSTAARYKASLKAQMQQARGSEMTLGDRMRLDDFFKTLKIPKPESRITTAKILSPKDRKTIRNAAGAKTNLLIQALYESGARVSEIINLKIANCKSIKGITYCQVLGKGRKFRTVYLKAQTFNKIKKLYKSRTYLFETATGTPLSRYTAHTLVRRAGRKVGRHLHPHMLRHSRATDLLNAGETLPAVSAYLGHSSPEITARFYLHGLPDAKKILQNLD
jgi:integrase/recombinase XerD